MYLFCRYTSYDEVTYVVPRRWIHSVVDDYSMVYGYVGMPFQSTTEDEGRLIGRDLTIDGYSLLFAIIW